MLVDHFVDQDAVLNCWEIKKLARMLDTARIPFVFTRRFDHPIKKGQSSYHLEYPVSSLSNCAKRVCSVIQGYGTYGMEENKLEIMGLIEPWETDDSVLGHLTAEDVFNRISKHWKEHHTEYGQ